MTHTRPVGANADSSGQRIDSTILDLDASWTPGAIEQIKANLASIGCY